MAYLAVAITASVLFVVAGWRSRHLSVARFGDMNELLDLSSPAGPSDSAITQPLGDVAQSTQIALKRLAPVMLSQSVRIDVAVRPGLLVRMRGPALADLMEELLAAAIDIAPASMLLLTATMRGDRVYISLSDDMPSAADPAFRQGRVRGLAERIAMRGGALDINVKPDEGTTVTLRLAAAFGSAMDMTEPFDISPILAQPAQINTGVISGTAKQ